MTDKDDAELYRRMHAIYDQLAQPVRGHVAVSYNKRRHMLLDDNRYHVHGEAMQGALREYGCLPQPPLVTEAGAQEYDEAMAAQELWDDERRGLPTL